MPKVVLIEPKAPNFHIYSQYKIPRLGPIILGTLMKERGWDVEVIFEEVQAIDFEKLITSDLVGISSITSTAPRAYALADKLRQAGVPVIMGGPHVTFLAEEALEHCDFVIRGEAELTLMKFLDAWETDQDYSQVPSLSYRPNGKNVHNLTGQEPIDLDDLPYPDVSLFPWSLDQTEGLISIPVLTSRGCPFQCAFCSVTGLFGRKYRFRSTENVIGELRRYNQPKSHVFFYDDNFAANPKRLKELLRAMLREGIQFTWSAQVRIDIAQDEELLSLMKQAGCLIVFIGFESVNPQSLQAMKKGQTLADMKTAIKLIRRHGIRVHGMFVYGFDEDDWKTVRKTVKFATRFGLSSTQFMILTPLPGSEFYRKVKKEGRFLFHDWGLFDAHHVVFQPAKFSLKTLQKAQMFSHKKFYSLLQSVKRILRRQWLEVGIAHYARNLNRVWKKKNQAYLKVIKLLASPKNGHISIDYKQDAGFD